MEFCCSVPETDERRRAATPIRIVRGVRRAALEGASRRANAVDQLCAVGTGLSEDATLVDCRLFRGDGERSALGVARGAGAVVRTRCGHGVHLSQTYHSDKYMRTKPVSWPPRTTTSFAPVRFARPRRGIGPISVSHFYTLWRRSFSLPTFVRRSPYASPAGGEYVSTTSYTAVSNSVNAAACSK
jgi:hypothetical protein